MPLKPAGSKTPHRPSASSSSSPNPKKKKHHKKSPTPSPSPSPNSPNPHRPKLPPPSTAPSMSRDGSESSRKRPHGQLDDEDTITILNAVIDFRANHGGVAPTPSTMKPVYETIKDNLHQEITFDQLYNKFRSLKHRYSKAVESGVGPTPFDRLFFDLSVRAWGEKKPKDADREGFETISNIKKKKKSSSKPKIEENGHGQEAAENCGEEEEGAAAEAEDDDDDDDGDDEVNEDVGDSFKLLIDQARKYWEKEGLSLPALELGLKFVDKSKAANLEKRWRQYFEAEWKIEAKTIEVKKDFLTSLCAVQKDASL